MHGSGSYHVGRAAESRPRGRILEGRKAKERAHAKTRREESTRLARCDHMQIRHVHDVARDAQIHRHTSHGRAVAGRQRWWPGGTPRLPNAGASHRSQRPIPVATDHQDATRTARRGTSLGKHRPATGRPARTSGTPRRGMPVFSSVGAVSCRKVWLVISAQLWAVSTPGRRTAAC